MSKYHLRRMDPDVFGLALSRIITRGRPNRMYEAARMVLVDGKSVAQACRIMGIERPAVYEGIRKIEAAYTDKNICPYCGQGMPHV